MALQFAKADARPWAIGMTRSLGSAAVFVITEMTRDPGAASRSQPSSWLATPKLDRHGQAAAKVGIGPAEEEPWRGVSRYRDHGDHAAEREVQEALSVG